ncbi:cytochrome P450 71A2-like protein [Tanacetum coccineum]
MVFYTFKISEKHALAKKHGPLMLLHFSRVPVVVASSADASREIMKTHDLIKSIPVLQLLSHKSSIVSSNERRRNGFDHREDQTNQLPSFPVVDLSMLLMSLTNGVICRAALGRKHDGEKFKELFANFIELLGVFSVGDYIPWMSWVDRLIGYDVRAVKITAEFDAFLEGVIEEHVERNIQTSSGDDDVFTGGTDSTYTTLEWEFSKLIRNPNAMKMLQEDVREVAKGKLKITEDNLDEMQYLKAVVKETFRMHTPLPLLVPRESTHDVKVLGYDIAADAWAVEQDPCLRDHPEEFRPERFLDSPVDYKGLHFELTPFGVGRRKCPGINFAMNVNELVLASLVNKFDFCAT